MANLNLKDLSLNWETPTVRYVRQIESPQDFVLIRRVDTEIHEAKTAAATLTFKKNAVDFFWGDKPPEKLAVSFESDGRLIFVFDPVEGVPFYKPLSPSKQTYNRVLNNRDLIDKIYEFFKLDKKNKNYWLKGYRGDVNNGMTLFIMTPQGFEDKLPLFDDEKFGR